MNRMWSPENQKKMIIQVKLSKSEIPDSDRSPARLPQLRCGRKTRKAVAPTPRQSEPILA